MLHIIVRLGVLAAAVFIPCTQSSPQNITADDFYGDPATGEQFSYVGSWNVGQDCTGCLAQPDSSMTYNGTWHDGTTDATSFMSASFTFSGTAVWVYGVLIQAGINTSGFNTRTNLSFLIDNVPIWNLMIPPSTDDEAEPSYRYNVLLFHQDSLSAETHSFTLVNGMKALVILDYLVYTTFDEGSTDSAPVPVRPPATTFIPFASSTSPLSNSPSSTSPSSTFPSSTSPSSTSPSSTSPSGPSALTTFAASSLPSTSVSGPVTSTYASNSTPSNFGSISFSTPSASAHNTSASNTTSSSDSTETASAFSAKSGHSHVVLIAVLTTVGVMLVLIIIGAMQYWRKWPWNHVTTEESVVTNPPADLLPAMRTSLASSIVVEIQSAGEDPFSDVGANTVSTIVAESGSADGDTSQRGSASLPPSYEEIVARRARTPAFQPVSATPVQEVTSGYAAYLGVGKR
ncbi:hypothetical protein CERSUDRAFT_92042 [Gelatoporia subvermispora B]|uniref:Uncharacterized protein n=1 Tax=Ceriporiopsis subvermispora (strain B) TaxID=914234 RepID=M2PSB7_CERS8|nr:hypothetical protein CERSUDRAFT_92042 [Gelatoporia subvermispora B]